MTRNHSCLTISVLLSIALLAGCGRSEEASTAAQPAPSTAPQPVAKSESVETFSRYIAAEDGTRIALDVYLPAGRTDAEQHPALLTLTRYLRSTNNPETGERNPSLSPLDQLFLDNGYALVKVDARGSGASFGTRPVEYGPEEVRDAYAVVDWVVGQDWSDGQVGAYGTSYTGTTAELLAAVNHPAVKAVIPGWSDFDGYASPTRPYGLLASSFLSTWAQVVGWMDSGDPQLGAVINPVEEDVEGVLLKQAHEDHKANPNVFEATRNAEYRDDLFDGVPFSQIGPIAYKAEIERSGVPMLVFVSWLDAGTADGTLQRFNHFSNPQKVMIMAGTHGGGLHASPYTVGAEGTEHQPPQSRQFEMRLAFFDHHLKGIDNEVAGWPPIRFFNMGEERYHETDVWPPAGTVDRTLAFSQGGGLSFDADVAGGDDDYAVDRGVNTGDGNRWLAQMGRPIVNLDDRGAMDERMLTYTTEPLAEPLQIAGYPVVSLNMASDREDGMVLVYLEDVGPDGRSRYLTEGGLRLIHRKESESPYYDTGRPYHSYERADAMPMKPGEFAQVRFYLWPIAALIQPGHRLRVAVAGADSAVFDPLPAEGDVNLTVRSGGESGSNLVLPVVSGGLQ